MTQKTAMQDLKFICNNFIGRFMLDDLNKIIDSMIERERQQIIDAYEAGDKYKFEQSGEQFYNEKYDQ